MKDFVVYSIDEFKEASERIIDNAVENGSNYLYFYINPVVGSDESRILFEPEIGYLSASIILPLEELDDIMDKGFKEFKALEDMIEDMSFKELLAFYDKVFDEIARYNKEVIGFYEEAKELSIEERFNTGVLIRHICNTLQPLETLANKIFNVVNNKYPKQIKEFLNKK